MDLKSEQRIRYETEIALVQRRFGSLEDMRNTLGFSQRKMAELLMVDPSAWTRWTKDGDEKAPPYVYRALAWYLELLELRRVNVPMPSASKPLAPAPERDVQTATIAKVNFESVKGEMRGEWQQQVELLKEHYEQQLHDLRARDQADLMDKISKSEQITLGWKLFLLINTAAIIYIIFASLF